MVVLILTASATNFAMKSLHQNIHLVMDLNDLGGMGCFSILFYAHKMCTHKYYELVTCFFKISNQTGFVPM